MKRLTHFLGVLIVAGVVLAFANPKSLAGRAGGPLTTTVTVPAAQSVYFDIYYTTGQAVASVNGNGQAYIFIYDSDGHVATGVGGTFKTASMNVYRAGTLRIEIRNAGLLDQVVALTTN